jgi:hypothetical protein
VDKEAAAWADEVTRLMRKRKPLRDEAGARSKPRAKMPAAMRDDEGGILEYQGEEPPAHPGPVIDLAQPTSAKHRERERIRAWLKAWRVAKGKKG